MIPLNVRESRQHSRARGRRRRRGAVRGGRQRSARAARRAACRRRCATWSCASRSTSGRRSPPPSAMARDALVEALAHNPLVPLARAWRRTLVDELTLVMDDAAARSRDGPAAGHRHQHHQHGRRRAVPDHPVHGAGDERPAHPLRLGRGRHARAGRRPRLRAARRRAFPAAAGRTSICARPSSRSASAG